MTPPAGRVWTLCTTAHKRNKIVHFGEINFQKADAEMCLRLATTLTQILRAMDAESCRALDAKHSAR